MVASFIEFLNSGGVFMYIILSVSLLALTIIVERTVVLTLSYNYDAAFFRSALSHLRNKNFSHSLRMCSTTTHPLARILVNVFQYSDQSIDAMESAAHISLQKFVQKMQKRTNYLSLFGNVATLLGLLGTIQGLIMSFSSLSNVSGAEKSELLAVGISTAMNTTAFGLVVAIPCIVAFHILSNKESQILTQYEETVNEAIHILEHSLGESRVQRSAAPTHQMPPVMNQNFGSSAG